MNPLMRLLLIVGGVSILWATPAAGQAAYVPTLAEVQVLLQSTEPKDQAWGAWWAGEASMPEITPLLLSNLSSRLAGSTWQDDAVIDTTLDALIRSRVRDLPITLIESVYAHRKAQALILLPQVKVEPALDSFLLKLTHEKTRDGLGMEWFAAANLLLQRRVPGFTAAVLEDMTLRGFVVLCDPGQACFLPRIGRNSIADGLGFISPGFPPWPTYTMQKNARGSTAVLPGPIPMGYSRLVTPEGRRGQMGESRGQSPASPGTADRLLYLAAAAPRVQMTLRNDEDLKVVWESKTALDAAVEAFKGDIRSRYLRMIQQLRDEGLLSPEEFSKLETPNLTVTIDDLRTTKTPL